MNYTSASDFTRDALIHKKLIESQCYNRMKIIRLRDDSKDMQRIHMCVFFVVFPTLYASRALVDVLFPPLPLGGGGGGVRWTLKGYAARACLVNKYFTKETPTE